LKIFKEIGSKTERGFENERHTLSTITKVPHDNITAHLASWTQSDKFYMLFPCAEMNLRQFWQTWPRPELHNKVVGWLLSQFKGLADGVRHIHNLGPANLSPKSLGKNLLASESSRTGFHHDLKPENILVFTQVSGLNRPPSLSDFILKISDFGTAKINTVLSGADHTHYTSNLSFGDSAYGAPDFALEGRTSRPYDIWSLGCIFLEMMLWTFDVSGSDLGIFAQDRLECVGAQPHQSGAFWHQDRDHKIRLKKPVLERLGQLEEHCRPQGVFGNIVSATGRMLQKDPKQRIKAPALCNLLDAALLQASFDLEIEGYYMNNAKVPLYAAAPTLVSEETPGQHSIDDRSIYAPEDGYLRVLESDHHVHSPPNQVGLAPINTQSSNTTLPSSPTSPRHNRTPSITLSDHNNPFTSRVILDANTEEGSEQPPMGESPIGAHKVLVGRGDVSDGGYRIQRHSSSSVESEK
jgi:serine/threonine protein kinase